MGRKRTEGWGYERAGVVSIEEVLPLILDENIQKVEFHGHKVNVTSLRLQTFATKGLCCSNCGLKATHFAVETQVGQVAWHLNLWADRSHEGKGEMLMTHDHTLARGLGGADHIDNVTTMCRKCNFNKSIDERAEYNKRNGIISRKERLAAERAAQTEPSYHAHIKPGDRIVKKSGHKFKCDKHEVTVQALCSSLMDPKRRLAYVIAEDQTIVNAHQCQPA